MQFTQQSLLNEEGDAKRAVGESITYTEIARMTQHAANQLPKTAGEMIDYPPSLTTFRKQLLGDP